MDSGRAFQLRAQVVRRHRLVLAICCLALVVLACVVVAMAVKYALTSKTAADGEMTSAAPGVAGSPMRLAGGWSQWLRWSVCTRTCGGGSRIRRRYCDDPEPEAGGAPCGGEGEQTTTCSVWPCPDCDRPCRRGVLTDCSYCACAMTSLSGHVHDAAGTPIHDISVFLLSRQWLPLAETNSGGGFLLSNVCMEDMKLAFKKSGYTSAYLNVTSSSVNISDVRIVLHELQRPVVSLHPQDETVVEGSTLTLTCGSDAPEVTYEWFRDGQILVVRIEDSGSHSQSEEHAPTLTISNIRKTDAGLYRCRVVSAGGMMFSQPALVTVIERGSIDSCDNQPLPHYHRLPANCSIDGVTGELVDIRRCPRRSCTTAGPAPRTATAITTTTTTGGSPGLQQQQPTALCCGPVTTHTDIVTCNGWSYPIVGTFRCGCTTVCGGGDLAGVRPITLQAYLHDPMDSVDSLTPATTLTRLRYGRVDITSSHSGSFTLSVPIDATRVVLDLPADSLHDPTVQVIPVWRDTKRLAVVLQTKASPVRVHSSQKMVFPVMSAARVTSLPVASLVLPGYAAIDGRGRVYNGTVDVYTLFMDQRSVNEIVNVPGRFEYADSEGRRGHLELVGVMLLYTETTGGAGLEINAKVDVSLDVGGVGIEDAIHEEAVIRNFVLNHETGLWEMTDALWTCSSPGSCPTGKLQCHVDMHTGVRFIMAARVIRDSHLCELKVMTLREETHREPLPGHQVQVLSKRGERYVHLSRGITDDYGVVCLPVPCGCEHIVAARGLVPVADQRLPKAFAYRVVPGPHGGALHFRSQLRSEGIVSVDGPVHRFAARSCRRWYPAGAPARDFRVEFSGRDRGGLAGAGAGAGVEAGVGAGAGVGVGVGDRVGDYSGLLMVVEPRPQRELSWSYHSEDSALFSSCMVRVLFKRYSSLKVFSVSRQNNREGDLLGTYITTSSKPDTATDNSFVCLRVRCPVAQQSYGDVPQSTHVTTHVVTNRDHRLHCKIAIPEQSPLQLDRNANSAFTIHPSALTGAGFFRSIGRGATANQWAEHICTTSSEAAAELLCQMDP